MEYLHLLTILLSAVSENPPPIEETEEENSELIAYLEYPEEVTPLFSRDLEEINHESTNEFFQEKKKERNYDILAYGQLEVILPGAGLAVRTYGNHFGFEGNMSFFPRKGLLGFVVLQGPTMKFSASLFKSFGGETRHGWYAGGGVGLICWDDSNRSKVFLYAPVFLGYQSGRFFSDLGMDILFPSVPIPALRCGARF